MFLNSDTTTDFVDKPSQCTREVLVEQILWMIRLRWIAVGGMVAVTLLCSSVYPVLTNPLPIYICAAVLLGSNIVYFVTATKRAKDARPRDLVLGTIQVEADLLILTAVLHFSGGVINPFFLFYVFHVIIAAIILPRSLSFSVGLTAIFLFGLLGVSELRGGTILGYYPLRFSAAGGLWRNPVYALGVFAAFSFTVVIAQYLTRMIIIRMTAKELEAAQNSDVLNAIINAMSEGLIFVTNDGNTAICNPAAELWKNQDIAYGGRHPFEEFPRPLAELLKGLFSFDEKASPVGKTITFETTGPEAQYVEAKSCP
ncbi:MAG: hypothetical protein ACYTDW_22345, partial [Planctomycetota bacterium]